MSSSALAVPFPSMCLWTLWRRQEMSDGGFTTRPLPPRASWCPHALPLLPRGPLFYPLGEGFSGFPRALLYPDALRTGTARHSAFSDTFKMLRFACVPPQSEEVVIYTHSVPCFISWAPRMPSLYLCAPQNLWIKAPSTSVPGPCQPHHRHPAVLPIPLFLFLCSLPQLHRLQPVQTTHINKHTPGQLSRHVWIPVSASIWAHIAT